MELLEKRTYNSKIHDNSDGTFTLLAHTGHIHYRDRADGTFKPIDHTLTWDPIRRGWTFATHSFRPFIPEYADDWAVFRDLFHSKYQAVRFRALAAHVSGVLTPNLSGVSEVNCVVYADAFGPGHDLIYGFSRSALLKVVRIRDGFYPLADASFDFEVMWSAGLRLYRGGAERDMTEVAPSLLTSYEDGKQFFLGSEQGDGQEWFTHLRPPIVWDSDPDRPKRQRVPVRIFQSGGRTYLRKTILAAFFAGAVGDVYTDTVTSYYAGAGDGMVDNGAGSATWATEHDLLTGLTADNTSTFIAASTDSAAGKYTISRGFMPTDTSAIPDNATISAATFNAYLTVVNDADNDGSDFAVIVGPTSQASNTSLATADYDQCSGVDSPTKVSAGMDLTGLTTGAYKSFTLTDLTVISLTGYTLLGMRLGHDTDTGAGHANAPAGFNRFRFSSSEATGTTQDPYLSVTYTVPGDVASGFTLLGVGH